MSSVTFSTIDRLGKPTSMVIRADDAVADAPVQALTASLDTIIRGADTRAVVTLANVVDPGSKVPPADNLADRGNKWLFRTEVAAEGGKIYDNELGTADNTVLPGPAVDFIDLTAGIGATLKTDWEAVYRSPQGNPGVLLTVQQVNLNLN